MLIELHILQNFAPSCLNRDDTNAPKDCYFGGSRRSRISSQCIKRSIREAIRISDFPKESLGTRSKRLHQELCNALIERGKNVEDVAKISKFVIESSGLKVKEKSKEDLYGLTQYVIFFGHAEKERLVNLIESNWNDLLPMIASEKSKKELPKALKSELKEVFAGHKAGDIAMFGRMLADARKFNVDAACQVAHAISTHKIEMEMDFFTAVDDLKPDDTSGADMMGTVEFNSACFYRYAVINFEKLLQNLENDKELAIQMVDAFIRASVTAIPSGKQNTFAAHNPPSFIFSLVRDENNPWSLANAFEEPVRANGKGLVAASIENLAEYWTKLISVYGGQPRFASWLTLEDSIYLSDLGAKSKDFNELLTSIRNTIGGEET